MGDRADQQGPQPGDGEHVLHHDRSADQERQVDAEDDGDGADRVAEHVPRHDPSLGDALEPGDRHEVRLQDGDGAGPQRTHEYGRERDGQGEGRKHEVAQMAGEAGSKAPDRGPTELEPEDEDEHDADEEGGQCVAESEEDPGALVEQTAPADRRPQPERDAESSAEERSEADEHQRGPRPVEEKFPDRTAVLVGLPERTRDRTLEEQPILLQQRSIQSQPLADPFSGLRGVAVAEDLLGRVTRYQAEKQETDQRDPEQDRQQVRHPRPAQVHRPHNSVLRDGEGQQRVVVVAERRHLEPLDPLAAGVAERCVRQRDERRLVDDRLLDLGVQLGPLRVVDLRTSLGDHCGDGLVLPVAVEGVGTAIAVRTEGRDLVGVDDVVRPVAHSHTVGAGPLLVVRRRQLEGLDVDGDPDLLEVVLDYHGLRLRPRRH